MEISQGNQKKKFKEHLVVRNIEKDDLENEMKRLVKALKKKKDFETVDIVIGAKEGMGIVAIDTIAITEWLKHIIGVKKLLIIDIDDPLPQQFLKDFMLDTEKKLLVVCDYRLADKFLQVVKPLPESLLKDAIYLLNFKLV